MVEGRTSVIRDDVQAGSSSTAPSLQRFDGELSPMWAFLTFFLHLHAHVKSLSGSPIAGRTSASRMIIELLSQRPNTGTPQNGDRTGGSQEFVADLERMTEGALAAQKVGRLEKEMRGAKQDGFTFAA